MKTPVDPSTLRQSLLDALEAGPAHEEELLAELDQQRARGTPLYSSILNILTHLNFSEAEAQRHWRRLQSHREALRSRLGRDAGLRVALLDYFLNIDRELKNPKVIEISSYARTERSAVTDGLTGLFNHSYFLQALRQEVLRAKRHDLKTSLALFDLDDFKRVNDSRGHLEGDRILARSAALIRESVREIDVSARYGGEEFAVILPETSGTGAYVVAERVRRRIEERFRRAKVVPKVTISGGVATYPDDAGTPADLIVKADEGLYRAKAAGKNRITLMQGERRRHLREAADQSVTLGAPGPRAAARVKNVSEGGLLMTLKKPVPVGSMVSLVIRPADSPRVGLRGEVVRVEAASGRSHPSYDVGVRLLPNPDRPAHLILRGAKAPAGA
ncbi:MAG TPA: diguanylate cyclase [Vicinamibacteria bacterium]|nr:diguanylate cyclase [Vicinamibacteria bacterium]